MSDKTALLDQNKSGGTPQAQSIFMNVNIAGLRCVQLTQGARSRLGTDYAKRRNTSIAIEEVRQGLIEYNFVEKVIV